MADLIQMAGQIFTSYGMAGLILLVALYCCFRLVKYVFEGADTREKAYLEIIKDQTAAMNAHTEQAKEFHNEVIVAHEFQRKEHEQLGKTLEAICARIQ